MINFIYSWLKGTVAPNLKCQVLIKLSIPEWLRMSTYWSFKRMQMNIELICSRCTRRAWVYCSVLTVPAWMYRYCSAFTVSAWMYCSAFTVSAWVYCSVLTVPALVYFFLTVYQPHYIYCAVFTVSLYQQFSVRVHKPMVTGFSLHQPLYIHCSVFTDITSPAVLSACTISPWLLVSHWTSHST